MDNIVHVVRVLYYPWFGHGLGARVRRRAASAIVKFAVQKFSQYSRLKRDREYFRARNFFYSYGISVLSVPSSRSHSSSSPIAAS